MDGGPHRDQGQPQAQLKIDAKSATAFIRQFKGLVKDTSDGTLRIFSRSDCYTCHGDDANYIAKEFYKTPAVLKQLQGEGSQSLVTVTFQEKMFRSIVREVLLSRGDRTVKLYDVSGSKLTLSSTASPGNLSEFEDILFQNSEMEEAAVLVAVKVIVRGSERLVGLASVDSVQRDFGVGQFLDDESYNNLESALVMMGTKEAIIPQNMDSQELRKVKDAMDRTSVLCSERPVAMFSAKNLNQDMERLLKKGEFVRSRDLVEQEGAAEALSAVIAHSEVLSDDVNHYRFSVHEVRLQKYMRLDSAALRALNVLKTKGEGNQGHGQSLESILGRAKTAMGKRLLGRWLKQPLLDVDQINERLDVVEAFHNDMSTRSTLRDQHFQRLPDIERLASKIQRKKAALKDVVMLYQASIRVPYITDAISKLEGSNTELMNSKYVEPLRSFSGAEFLGKFEDLVESAVDLEELSQGEYFISAEYDEELKEYQAERKKLKDSIKALHRNTAFDLDMETEGHGQRIVRLEEDKRLGFFFRITKKDETTVRKKLQRYITLEVRKDGLKFTSSKLRSLSDKYQLCTQQYLAKQKELADKVVEVASTFSEVFEEVSGILAKLDVLAGFADIAACAPIEYARPQIRPMEDGNIEIFNGRHPCVEVQDNVSFIPNDTQLLKGASYFHIITGPNMGGKSTYIRQLGVIVFMAQVGSFVPADSATISIRDCIFARVGASDCQLRGVSTFMAEMLEAAAIIKKATAGSLVIVDELGRGTSTYDGFGLAWAISEHLAQVIRCPTLFATHFHELTALADEDKKADNPAGIANYHVSAKVDQGSGKVTMLYKVNQGSCDRSFGIHVAKYTNFPSEVIAMATEKAEKLERNAEERMTKRLKVGETAQLMAVG